MLVASTTTVSFALFKLNRAIAVSRLGLFPQPITNSPICSAPPWSAPSPP
jgi:hypothetical protein